MNTYETTFLDSVLIRRINSGVIEMTTSFEATLYKIYDVGGQVNERKKWSNCLKISFFLTFNINST